VLAREFRLPKTKDIEAVLKRGRYRHVRDLFLIKWLKNDQSNHRITFVVSSKISKKAVDRNRIKRTLSNNIPPELLQGLQNYDIVVVAKKSILDLLPNAHNAFIKELTTLKPNNDKKN
jgi:ribonuclease P protein component